MLFINCLRNSITTSYRAFFVIFIIQLETDPAFFEDTCILLDVACSLNGLSAVSHVQPLTVAPLADEEQRSLQKQSCSCYNWNITKLLGVIQSSLSFMLYDKKVIEYQDFSLKQIQVHTVHMHEPILHLYPDYQLQLLTICDHLKVKLFDAEWHSSCFK